MVICPWASSEMSGSGYFLVWHWPRTEASWLGKATCSWVRSRVCSRNSHCCGSGSKESLGAEHRFDYCRFHSWLEFLHLWKKLSPKRFDIRPSFLQSSLLGLLPELKVKLQIFSAHVLFGDGMAPRQQMARDSIELLFVTSCGVRTCGSFKQAACNVDRAVIVSLGTLIKD